VVVESTYNWSWLVDGLMEADYRVHLANPAAMQQYNGLKYTADYADAHWLAHVLRLGVLPEGYLYPKDEQAVRDGLRKRSHLVRRQTTHVLSLPNILMRNTGIRLRAKRMHAWPLEEVERLLPEPAQVLAVTSSLAILHGLGQQSKTLDKAVSKRLKHTPAYAQLLTVDGMGTIVAPTIVLETGDSGRFPPVGHSASYCRCVGSTNISNGKRKGQGHVKNGHPSLAWASMEAAQCAIRCSPTVQRFDQRKQVKSHLMIARKAMAHTLARACYYMMRDRVPFEGHKAFGGGCATSEGGVRDGEEIWFATMRLMRPDLNP
jgi:transposase